MGEGLAPRGLVLGYSSHLLTNIINKGGSKIWLAIFHSFMLQQAGKGESPIVFLLHE